MLGKTIFWANNFCGKILFSQTLFAKHNVWQKKNDNKNDRLNKLFRKNLQSFENIFVEEKIYYSLSLAI